jgi:hypothetical protein
MRLFISLVIFMSLVQFVWAENSAYEDTLSGKRCKETNQQINCNYKVGKDLEFSIDGIGLPDTGITISHSKGVEGGMVALS